MEAEITSSSPSWLKRLIPIKRYELKKVIPLLLLKFFISFNYAILTCMKDTLVVTAKGSGAEVIPVLKGWIVLPVAIFAAMVFSKLSNLIKRSTLNYLTVSLFMAILLLYGFVLYPYQNFFIPQASANWLQGLLGDNYSHWVSIYRYWMHSLFFVTAELWASLIIFLVYWGYVNQISGVGDAKRTYTLFIAAGDIATMMTGPLVLFFVRKYSLIGFTPTLKSLVLIVSLFCLIIIGLIWWMNRYVLTDPRFYNPEKIAKHVEKKTKLSLYQSIKHIFSSKYLLHIAVLVVGCALTINMVEVTWKANLKLLYPNPSDYQAFMGKLTMWIGFVALITVLVFGGTTLRKFGWKLTASITPIVIGTTGLIFFLLNMSKGWIDTYLGSFGISALMLVVLFGAFQNILSKVVKYSFFDSTKEIVFIPLDHESKVKGKAAIDLVGSRFGKSGSSWIQIGIIDLLGTGSVLTITPYLLPLLIGMLFAWFHSIRYIGKDFEKQEQQDQEHLEEEGIKIISTSS